MGVRLNEESDISGGDHCGQGRERVDGQLRRGGWSGEGFGQ